MLFNPRIFVSPEAFEQIDPCSLEFVLNQCDFREKCKVGLGPVLKQGPLSREDFSLAGNLPNLSVWPIRNDCQGRTKEHVGYFVEIPRAEGQIEILFLLLAPGVLFRKSDPKILAFSLRRERGNLVQAQFFNGLKVRRTTIACSSNESVRLYLAWPQAKFYQKQGWVMHRPCVPDEDTRACAQELPAIRWVAAPSELLTFAGVFGRSTTSLTTLYQNCLADHHTESDDSDHTLTNSEVTAIFVIAGVWAFVSLVVVVVLFVKLKKRHSKQIQVEGRT